MTNLNLLKDSEKKVFYHYLIPSICSTLVTSIYILVDTLIIGQGVGSDEVKRTLAPKHRRVCALGPAWFASFFICNLNK